MILFWYFARKFLWTFLAITGLFLAILVLIDMVEQIQKLSKTSASFGDAVALTLLNAPASLYAILPLIVILATVALFLNLARTSELVATRAAGRSAGRMLVAPVSMALGLGVLVVAVLNPLVAATSKRYDSQTNRFVHGADSALSLSGGGLWLRQGGPAGQTVIRAQSSNQDATRLRNVSFYSFGPNGAPIRRIEAGRAVLVPGAWQLSNVKLWPLAGSANPELDARKQASLRLPSDLTRTQIRDSFGKPSTIPIWELPAFIGRLDQAGFSARAHRVWFQMELAKPLLFVAMVLIGAVFTMRHARFGHTGVMVLAAILTGFGLFFVRNFTQIMGENGQIPIMLAAWAPPVVAILLALGLLLHLEDG